MNAGHLPLREDRVRSLKTDRPTDELGLLEVWKLRGTSRIMKSITYLHLIRGCGDTRGGQMSLVVIVIGKVVLLVRTALAFTIRARHGGQGKRWGCKRTERGTEERLGVRKPRTTAGAAQRCCCRRTSHLPALGDIGWLKTARVGRCGEGRPPSRGAKGLRARCPFARVLPGESLV